MGAVTISITSPTARDLGTMTYLIKQLGISADALVVGGYDAITITADLDEIRREQERVAREMFNYMHGGPL